jgi:hypothetical protein
VFLQEAKSVNKLSKQEEFLWIVQTMVIANAINLSSVPDWAEDYRAEISASGVFITMDEAVRASGLIPEDLTAAEAANGFCSFTLKNLRDAEEKVAGHSLTVPHWFARY